MSLIPKQSVRSISSSKTQCDPRYSRLFWLSKLQHSNFRHERSWHDSAMARIDESVRSLQHVRLNTFKLTQPDTSWIMPVSETPPHFPIPISTKALQLTLIIWKLESETRAPSILSVRSFLRSLNWWRKVTGISWWIEIHYLNLSIWIRELHKAHKLTLDRTFTHEKRVASMKLQQTTMCFDYWNQCRWAQFVTPWYIQYLGIIQELFQFSATYFTHWLVPM